MTVDAAGILLSLAVVAGLVVALAVLEIVVRRTGASSNLTRRIAHVLACATGVGTFFAGGPLVTAVLGGVFVGGMLVSKAVGLLTSVHRVRRRSLGEVWLPAGIAIAALAAANEPSVFVATMLVTGLADVAAGLVGDANGAKQKSWAGSAAFALVAAASVLIVMPHPLWSPVTVLVATIVERLSGRGLDNLTVPLACLATLLAQATGAVAAL